MVVGGLIFNLTAAGATGTPSLFVTHLGTNISEPPTGDWSHSPSAKNGDFVQLYSEVGTHVSDAAENVTVRFELPGSAGGNVNSTVHATSSTAGVAERTDSANWSFRGASCKLAYVSGSASARVDRNRDGTPEMDGPISDSIVTSGVNFGTFTNGVSQVTFKARVECASVSSPTPTPSPSASLSPSASSSPCASCGGNNNNNNNSNSNNNENKNEIKVEQNNNQTVNVTASGGSVAGATTVSKTPETGVGVLGMAGMFSAAPLGLVLSRYGRGRVNLGKKDEDLSEIARGLVQKRGQEVNEG